ncbi:MAG: BolA/IbaG family iron-sulfur metabolism protein [Betaproteobacteria bacterium]|nr:BolA/IbaG family iron-sulfur metabolism protein [Betaproteobacteria bacterium]
MSLAEEIRGRLAFLDAESLEVFDDSADHAGHAGAMESGGGHFQVIAVSECFAGLPRLARHRLVYDAVRDLMPHRVHALAIVAQTPDEVAQHTSKS